MDQQGQARAPFIERGTDAFRNTNLAIFSVGFATFALLYCVQPLLPVFAREFRVGAAASSLALSLTTVALAVSMLVVGSAAEAIGRKSVMVASLAAASVLAMLAAIAPTWGLFLLVRTLEGVAFAGLPAIAMAYLSEEMSRDAIGLAMGLYIGGTGVGGMVGRIATAVIADQVSWRIAIALIGASGAIATLVLWRTLPASRHFTRREAHPRALARSFAAHLRDPGLVALYAVGFLVMGSFVAVYNYIGFRLLAPPYSLSQSAVGALFVVYVVGIVSSAVAGGVSDRYGRRRVLWILVATELAGALVTLARPLAVVAVGVALVTLGFFAAHSVVSSWVGLRAQTARAQASSLYLFAYYAGASVAGSIAGVFWSAEGWRGVGWFTSVLLMVATLIALWLTRLAPLPTGRPESPAPPRRADRVPPHP